MKKLIILKLIILSGNLMSSNFERSDRVSFLKSMTPHYILNDYHKPSPAINIYNFMTKEDHSSREVLIFSIKDSLK